MQLLSSDNILSHVNNVIHEGTQLHEQCIDLTVEAIYRPVRVGALDFGGSEFEPVGTETIQAIKQNNDDDYGWWNLQPGSYQAVFNEEITLNEDALAIISPHSHAVQAGITGSTLAISKGDKQILNFQVPQCGCNIKENARIATLYIMDI